MKKIIQRESKVRVWNKNNKCFELYPSIRGDAMSGLQDRKGKDIYENDIVCMYHLSDGNLKGSMHFKVCFKEYKEYEKYDDYYMRSHLGWCIESTNPSVKYTHSLIDITNRLEVIGNIHENPELLETSEEIKCEV